MNSTEKRTCVIRKAAFYVAMVMFVPISFGVANARAGVEARCLPDRNVELKLNGLPAVCSEARCSMLNGGGSHTGRGDRFVKDCTPDRFFYSTCRLVKDTTFRVVIQGAGTVDIPLSASAGNYSNVSLHQNGNFHVGWLTKDVVVKVPKQNYDGRRTEVACKGGHYIEFYKDGGLKVCVLKEPALLLKAVPGGSPKPIHCYPGNKKHEGHVGFNDQQMVVVCKETP